MRFILLLISLNLFSHTLYGAADLKPEVGSNLKSAKTPLDVKRAPASAEECIENLASEKPSYEINLENVLPPVNDQGNNGTCYAQSPITILSALKLKSLGRVSNRSLAFAQADYSPELTLLLLALKDDIFLDHRISTMRKEENGELFGLGWSEDVLNAIKRHPEVLVPISSDITYRYGLFKRPLRDKFDEVFYSVSHLKSSTSKEQIIYEIKNGLKQMILKLKKSNDNAAKISIKFLSDAGVNFDGKSLTVGNAKNSSGLKFRVKVAGIKNAKKATLNHCQSALDLIFEGLCNKTPVELSILSPISSTGYHSVTAIGILYDRKSNIPYLKVRDTAALSLGSNGIMRYPISELCSPTNDPRGRYKLYSATTAALE
jgi:hypothetical protein